MRDKKICTFINSRCLDLDITAKELEERIYNAICESGDNIDPKSLSTIYRWLNGEKTPDAEDYPYLAIALEITEDELRCGKLLPITRLKNEIDRLKELLNLNEKELNFITNVIWCSKDFSRYIASLVYSLSIYFFNTTYWENTFLYFLPLVLMIIIIKQDSKKYEKENKNSPKTKSIFLSETIEMWAGLKLMYKLYKQKSLIAISCINYLMIIVIIGLIPLIETMFYRGTFHLSGLLYLLVGTIFLVKSFTED